MLSHVCALFHQFLEEGPAGLSHSPRVMRYLGAATFWARESQPRTFLGPSGPGRLALAHQEPCQEGPVTAPRPPPPVGPGTLHHGLEAPSLLRGLLLRMHKAGPKPASPEAEASPQPTSAPRGLTASSGPGRAPTYCVGAEGLPLGAQEIGEVAVFAELHDHHEGAWDGAGRAEAGVGDRGRTEEPALQHHSRPPDLLAPRTPDPGACPPLPGRPGAYR